MNEHDCRQEGYQILGSKVFHHPRCGHIAGNRWLYRPSADAVLAMCCFQRWLEDGK